MYGYHEHIYDKKEFFSRINQKEVFQHVFGKDFEIGSYITSPFREDDSPGCWVQWNNGKLYFTDFASTYKRVNLDVIGIIQQKYNFSYSEAMDFILSFDFKEKPETPKHNETAIISAASSSLLEFCPKPFDHFHKQYWSQYEISSSQLIQDNIFATKWYKVKDYVFYPYACQTTYTISYPIFQSIKICNPKSTDKKKKWITNANKNVIGGTKNLPFAGDKLFISKSYKDWRVLTNLGLNVIYFQNEGMFPDMENLNIYIQLFTDVYILFDNDKAGIAASKNLTEYINSDYNNKAKSLILPTKEKDPADIVKAGKKQQLINFLFH